MVLASARHAILLLAGAGFFLIFGHLFIFLAYRVGPTGVVAPFYYFFTFWAVISGLVVFGQFPNGLAITGIFFIGYTYQKKESAPKWAVPTIGALVVLALATAVLGPIVS